MTFAKIKFSAQIRLETGLHIGGSTAFAAIGAMDSPVIKDPITNLPIIPGSSLKGKMRTLLAKVYNEKVAENQATIVMSLAVYLEIVKINDSKWDA